MITPETTVDEELEERILKAVLDDDDAEFLRLAEEYGGLERAQELVRAKGIVDRPGPIPTVRG
jgi:hypothetical protein